eukprot:g7480.t1 g7480   contig24:721706-722609(-)
MKLHLFTTIALALLQAAPTLSAGIRANAPDAFDFEEQAFLAKDNAATKRCIQRCARRSSNTRAYDSCVADCRASALPPGSSYCTWSPDTSCYKSGWPSCCSQNNGASCPSTQPQCDNRVVGRDYCTYSPQYNCYQSGWPACCSTNNGANCPSTQPFCDKGVGRSYCTFSPDYTCYQNGWPSCCESNDNGASCPAQQPECDVDSTQQCLQNCVNKWSGNINQYNNCSKNCYPGGSYCTYAPNTDCYFSGWPVCCQYNSGLDCPSSQPACEK